MANRATTLSLLVLACLLVPTVVAVVPTTPVTVQHWYAYGETTRANAPFNVLHVAGAPGTGLAGVGHFGNGFEDDRILLLLTCVRVASVEGPLVNDNYVTFSASAVSDAGTRYYIELDHYNGVGYGRAGTNVDADRPCGVAAEQEYEYRCISYGQPLHEACRPDS